MRVPGLAQLSLALPFLRPYLPPSRLSYPSHPIPISHLFDNTGAGELGDFDTRGSSWPIEVLPVNEFVWEDVRYALPSSWGKRPDNVICNSQKLNVTGFGYVRELHLLYSGDWIDGETTERFVVEYENGKEETIQLSVKNWWNLHWLNEGVIKSHYHNTPTGPSYNLTQIHQFSSALTPGSPVLSITLPSTLSSWNRLHLFALSYTPGLPPHSGEPEHPSDLVLRHPRLTSKTQTLAPFAPLVELTFASLSPALPDTLFPIATPQTLHLRSKHFSQVELGRIYRLAPGDEIRVTIPVQWKDYERDQYETLLPAEIVMKEGSKETGRWIVDIEQRFDREMETPLWWDDAKFGIFIHWGIYSVPAWAPIGAYAEWYQWWLHNPADSGSEVWRYHREEYGEDFVYDQFIKNFTAIHFNATDWIELFQGAGAKYFVLTTKHHDGFALFDTKSSSHRSSKYLGPKRDFLSELMQAAKNASFRRGTYFSMPEWFSPDYAKYGIDRFPGGLAHHPFKEDVYENYTGRLEVRDYLEDVQLAQMRMLARDYETEILWCDIGGPNLTYKFAAEWYAQAKREGRQVTMNNRCGSHASFDTPEFARFSAIQTHKWETSEGIDPYSYGLNKRTKAEDYRSADTIVRSLVDIVSKNGNYLLNLGPDGEGRIIDPMRERLAKVGKWLKHSGDCIYGTTYSFLGGEYDNLRFTTTPTSFCIISLDRPQGGKLSIPAARQIPIRKGDHVKLLGAGNGTLKWEQDEEGVVFHVDEALLDSVEHAWAFKIDFVGQ